MAVQGCARIVISAVVFEEQFYRFDDVNVIIDYENLFHRAVP